MLLIPLPHSASHGTISLSTWISLSAYSTCVKGSVWSAEQIYRLAPLLPLNLDVDSRNS